MDDEDVVLTGSTIIIYYMNIMCKMDEIKFYW